MKTDQPEYNPGGTVQVSGSLTFNGTLTTEGLVGVEIDNSYGPLSVRTAPAANPPSQTPYVYTDYVAPCYLNGTPTFSFQRDTIAHFKLQVVNLNPYQSYVVYTMFSLYDNTSTPLGTEGSFETILPNNESLIIVSYEIPPYAALGTATVYADAFSNWPKLGGTPYVREVSATFQIVGDPSGAGQPTQNQSPKPQSTGTTNYDLAFNIATYVTPETLYVYVTSSYQGLSAFNSTTIPILYGPPHKTGDLGGGLPPQFLKFDGGVGGDDLALFLQCLHGTAPAKYMYLGDLGGGTPVPKFFKYDGAVNGKDFALFLECYHGLGPTGPVANFTWSPLRPLIDQTVTFNASKSYDDKYGTITSYEWNFGDGNTTTVTNPIVPHIFTSHGNYTVTLTVIDNDTQPGSTSHIISI